MLKNFWNDFKVLSRLIQKSLLFSKFSEGGMFRILYYTTVLAGAFSIDKKIS